VNVGTGTVVDDVIGGAPRLLCISVDTGARHGGCDRRPESAGGRNRDAKAFLDHRRRKTMIESTTSPSPWLTVAEAAQRARCGVKTVYREVRAGRLRAARIGGRRELRLRPEWVDAWLDQTSAVMVIAERL
jgi:excisionase family DNA binding protein